MKFKFEESFVDEDVFIVGYGLKDFITDVGGLLGLFLGCSTMSLVELVYHPLRILLTKFINKKKNVVEILTVQTTSRGEILQHSDLPFNDIAVFSRVSQVHKTPNAISENEISEEVLERCFG